MNTKARTHAQEREGGEKRRKIQILPLNLPWSGHPLPARDNNRKWLTRLPSRAPALACGNADGIVPNNTVHVRRLRVSKYRTLTKSCFVLRKQDMNPQRREKACPSFSPQAFVRPAEVRTRHADFVCWSERSTVLEPKVGFDG